MQKFAKHRDLFFFASVGGASFIVDYAIFVLLKLLCLEQKPTIAKIIAGTIATVFSYYLNRNLSFKYRGGLSRQKEALLFFLISGIGVIIQSLPIFLANNIFQVRQNLSPHGKQVLDFILGYIIGNTTQMIFRFWALRKYAFPQDIGKSITQKSAGL